MFILCQNNNGLQPSGNQLFRGGDVYIYRWYYEEDLPKDLGKYENILCEVKLKGDTDV